MRAVIVSQHFPPETAATGRRAMDFAEELTARGHEVTVVTGWPNHAAYTGTGGHAPQPVAARYEVRRVRAWRTSWAGMLQRMVTYASFSLGAAWVTWRAAGTADVVIAISPLPTGLAALVGAALRGRPLIFDLQDIWPESARVCDVLPDGRLFRLFRCLETFFYRRCAAMTVISPGFARYVAGHGVARERIHVLHNGVDAALFAGPEPDEAFVKDHGLEGKFVVMYFGNVGLAQGLHTLLAAAEALRADPDLVFVILGNGVDRARLEGIARARGLTNVRFVPTQPRARLAGIVTLAHVLVVMLRKADIFEITIPSKLYECLAAGRPILCAVSGDAASIVEASGGGVTVGPENTAEVVEGIRRLRADYQLYGRDAEKAREFVTSTFGRDQIGDEIDEICRAVVERRRPRPGRMEANEA